MFSIYYNIKVYYNYTVLQDCREGVQPGTTIQLVNFPPNILGSLIFAN